MLPRADGAHSRIHGLEIGLSFCSSGPSFGMNWIRCEHLSRPRAALPPPADAPCPPAATIRRSSPSPFGLLACWEPHPCLGLCLSHFWLTLAVRSTAGPVWIPLLDARDSRSDETRISPVSRSGVGAPGSAYAVEKVGAEDAEYVGVARVSPRQ